MLLRKYQKGGQIKDQWGRPEGSTWYGFDPDKKQFTNKDQWGRTPTDTWYGFNPDSKRWTLGTKAQQDNRKNFIEDNNVTVPQPPPTPKTQAEAEEMMRTGVLKYENYEQRRLRNEREAKEREQARVQSLKDYDKRTSDPSYGWGLAPKDGESWRDFWAAEAAPLDAKFRFSQKDNFFDDFLNPGVWVGSMAKALGSAPKTAKETNSVLPYVTSVGAPLLSGALGGIGVKGTGQFVNNLVNPVAGMGVGNYTKAQLQAMILAQNLNKNVKKTVLNKAKPASATIPRVDVLDTHSTIGKHSDIKTQLPPEQYSVLLKKALSLRHARPIIRFKNLTPESYAHKNRDYTALGFKSMICSPGSECAKTANAVNNHLYKEVTGKKFDYNANAHNAWHMEDQMTKHGGQTLNSPLSALLGDRLLMGNNVSQATHVPGMIADPSIRHAGIYAGDYIVDGTRIPAVFESGRGNPLFLNPYGYNFTGENSVLKAVRPAQHNQEFFESLVDKNIRYAYRNKPSVYNIHSKNKQAQQYLDEMDKFRDEVKNTYDLTNDEFDQIKANLIGISAQETKLGATLGDNTLKKFKVRLQDTLNAYNLTQPIKTVKGTVGKTLNKLSETNKNLLPYPGSALLEKEAALLSASNDVPFTEALSTVRSKYQPKPKYYSNTSSPSKGPFRQKHPTATDQKLNTILGRKSPARDALGQMAENFNRVKKLYPTATPTQLMDLTTLMWNSPGKASNKELTDFFLFGIDNPDKTRFSFDYINKVNKHKNSLIEMPVNRGGLTPELRLHNVEGPEIYYKQGGLIKYKK